MCQAFFIHAPKSSKNGSSRINTDCINKINDFLKLFYLNTQCIRNKIDELHFFLGNKAFNILCFAEHWLVNNEVNFYKIEGFNLASIYCRNNLKNGGVSIMVSNDTTFSEIDIKLYCIEQSLEVVAIYILKFNMLVMSLYRSPKGDLDLFFTKFETILLRFSKLNHRVLICGDFNIDFNVHS